MAIGLRFKFEGGTQDQYDALHGQMGIDDDPPEGLIFHSAGPIEGGWGVIDFWESREHFDRFQRLAAGTGDSGARRPGLPGPARHQGVPGPPHHQAVGAMGLNLASLLTESAARAPEQPGDPPRRRRAELRRARRAQRPPGDAAAREGASSRATGSA